MTQKSEIEGHIFLHCLYLFLFFHQQVQSTRGSTNHLGQKAEVSCKLRQLRDDRRESTLTVADWPVCLQTSVDHIIKQMCNIHERAAQVSTRWQHRAAPGNSFFAWFQWRHSKHALANA